MRKTAIITAVLVVTAATMFASLQASGQNYNIPNWIKNNAKWWSEGQIDDSDFISGIKYLIENDVMVIEQNDVAEPKTVLDIDTNTYFNPVYGVKFKYPESWTVLEGFMGSVVTFVEVSEPNNFDSGESVNLMIENISGTGISHSKEYVKLTISLLENSITNFRLQDSFEREINGRQASVIIYTASQGKSDHVVAQYAIVENDLAYVLTHFTPLKKADEIETATAIIQSFDIFNVEKTNELNEGLVFRN